MHEISQIQFLVGFGNTITVTVPILGSSGNLIGTLIKVWFFEGRRHVACHRSSVAIWSRRFSKRVKSSSKGVSSGGSKRVSEGVSNRDSKRGSERVSKGASKRSRSAGTNGITRITQSKGMCM